MKKTAAKGHTRKHAGTRKHAHTAKHHPAAHKGGAVAHAHHVHTVARHARHAKARGLALSGMAVCTAEALAASLRLSGLPAGSADVLDLFWHAGGSPDAGAPILATLEAAAEYGLAGIRPASFGPAAIRDADSPPLSGVLLGLELPGPHAVLATADGWWSWGELYCPCEFPGAVIEEAWAVRWAVAA